MTRRCLTQRSRPAARSFPRSCWRSCRESRLWQRFQMPDRAARRERRCRRDHGIGVDAVVPIEVRDRTGLPEMLDAEWPHPMAVYGAEPGECCGMTIEHRHDAAMGRYVGQKFLDMRAGMNEAALARALRRGPAGVKPIRRRHGEK